jgi:2-aminoadipate transaminase
LAGQLGLNRTTVSAAYALLESEGLIAGHVGRGSFVTGRRLRRRGETIGTRQLFALASVRAAVSARGVSQDCAEVIASDDAASILQLGSPAGYPPLRRYLLEQARAEGTARESDDILITSGCQQASIFCSARSARERHGADRRSGVSGSSQRV